jgi:hypothetical protein
MAGVMVPVGAINSHVIEIEEKNTMIQSQHAGNITQSVTANNELQ